MSVNLFQTCPAQSYLPATIRHNMAGWFVEFYAFNPLTQKRERVKYRLNKYRQKFRTMQEFRVWTGQLCYSINSKLSAGWSPFGGSAFSMSNTAITTAQQMMAAPMIGVPQMPVVTPIVPMQPQVVAQSNVSTKPKKKTRADEPLIKVIDKFIEEKTLELRKSTLYSYNSFCVNFKAWVKENYSNITASEFTQEYALEYMEYVFRGGNSRPHAKAKLSDNGTVCPRTYNNNLKQGRAVFSWAVSNCYATDNPFAKIKVKREEEKQRILIPQDVRAKIANYFREKNPAMMIICDMTYSTLLRPIEISRIQIKYIDIEHGTITMPGDKTKNHKNRICRISPNILPIIKEYIKDAGLDDYLIADGCWKCGKKPMNSHSFSGAWDRMRTDLGLPNEMQLYSLRDTGINNMLRAGLDPLSVMQAADHHDLSMTTRYANHADSELFQRLNEKAPSF